MEVFEDPARSSAGRPRAGKYVPRPHLQARAGHIALAEDRHVEGCRSSRRPYRLDRLEILLTPCTSRCQSLPCRHRSSRLRTGSGTPCRSGTWRAVFLFIPLLARRENLRWVNTWIEEHDMTPSVTESKLDAEREESPVASRRTYNRAGTLATERWRNERDRMARARADVYRGGT